MQVRAKQALIAASTAAFILLAGVYVRPIAIRQVNNVPDDTGFAELQVARPPLRKKQTIPPPVVSTVAFSDTFSTAATIEEAGSMSGSNSSSWWVSSGAYSYSADGIGSTVLGSLSATNPWRVAYYISNSIDTDGGYHPQNIFRLVTKTAWQNYAQEAYFNTVTLNTSESTERDAWSGIFFFNRYQDQNNVYYTGIRDDGRVVIKAKKAGIYTTLADKVFWSGTYNRTTNPTLLPKNKWIGLKSEVKTLTNNTVSVKVYIDETGGGTWTLAIEATDTQNPILTAGYAGIRTDFRDVQFDNFKITNL